MKAIITDCDHDSIKIEKELFKKANIPLELKQCHSEEEIIKQCQDGDIFIVQYAPITRKVMEACPNLKGIIRYGVGVDTLDVKAATDLGIQIGNVPDYGINEVADHALALALTMLRKIVKMNDQVKHQEWDYTSAIPIHRFNELTCGIVGLGRIGKNLAQKMKALGFHVIAYDPYLEKMGTEKEIDLVSFDELLKHSDIVSIHCPLDGNENLFNKETLKKMKDTACLINVARGGIINEEDLLEAIQDKEIAQVALDCLKQESASLDNPLLKLDNVIVTPHMAWYSEESNKELKRKVAQEAIRLLNQKPLRYPINHPNENKIH